VQSDSGELTVVDYSFELAPGVVLLAAEPDVLAVACVPDAANASRVTLLLTLKAGAAVASRLSPGARLVNESTIACGAANVPIQHEVLATGAPAAATSADGTFLVSVTAVQDANFSSYANITGYTFFNGALHEYDAYASRALRLNATEGDGWVYTTSDGDDATTAGMGTATGGNATAVVDGLRGRGLSGSTTEIYETVSTTLFSLTNTQLLNSQGLSVTCTQCTLVGTAGIFISMLPSSQYAFVEVFGDLTLRTKLSITISAGWQMSEYSETKVTPTCIFPLCWGVSIFGLVAFSAGARVGLDTVHSYYVTSSTSFTLDATATAWADLWGEFSYGSLGQYGLDAQVYGDSVLQSAPLSQLSVDISSGLRPRLQVGVWGSVNALLAGGSVAVYAEGSFNRYLAFHAEMSSVNYAGAAPASYAGYTGCADVQDSRMLLSTGTKARSLTFNVMADVWAGCFFTLCAMRWNPQFLRTWNFDDTAPTPFWGACGNLFLDTAAPSPPLPPPPRPSPPPRPPLAPGVAGLCPDFSSGGVALQTAGTSSVYATCNVALTVGQVITVATCGIAGASCQGDTALGVYFSNGTLAGYNDDFSNFSPSTGCSSLCSSLTLTVSLTSLYIITEGCYSSTTPNGGTCSGTAAYTIVSPPPPASPPSPPSPPPSPPTPPPLPPFPPASNSSMGVRYVFYRAGYLFDYEVNASTGKPCTDYFIGLASGFDGCAAACLATPGCAGFDVLAEMATAVGACYGVNLTRAELDSCVARGAQFRGPLVYSSFALLPASSPPPPGCVPACMHASFASCRLTRGPRPRHRPLRDAGLHQGMHLSTASRLARTHAFLLRAQAASAAAAAAAAARG
jgi:hypothetical protein